MKWWQIAAIGVWLGLGLVLLRACQEPVVGIAPYGAVIDPLDDPVVWLLVFIGLLVGADQLSDL